MAGAPASGSSAASSASASGGSLTLWQRIASASAGALITSIVVTPFDVVKTRLQSQVQTDVVAARNPRSRAERWNDETEPHGVQEQDQPPFSAHVAQQGPPRHQGGRQLGSHAVL